MNNSKTEKSTILFMSSTIYISKENILFILYFSSSGWAEPLAFYHILRLAQYLGLT